MSQYFNSKRKEWVLETTVKAAEGCKHPTAPPSFGTCEPRQRPVRQESPKGARVALTLSQQLSH